MTRSRRNQDQSVCIARFKIDAFLAQLEQYINIEVLESEWTGFAATLQLKRFRAVSKVHFGVISQIKKKLIIRDILNM